MRRFGLKAAMLAAGVLTGGPASAWLAYPPDDQPGRLIVEIDSQVVDVVPLDSLPAPFDAVLRDAETAEKLVYRWRYSKTAEGLAVLVVDDRGRGGIRFGFAARPPLNGLRYAAAMVLLGPGRKPLHTFYARADEMRLDGGASFARYSVELDLARSPQWWRGVEALAFLKMSYHPLQRLDDQEIWRAMRRAVWHFTRGEGTEQRG
jgi:hypothetical protein